MRRIKYAGLVWVKILRSEWDWHGGALNPNLLKLPAKPRPRDNGRKSYNYFMLRGEK